MNIQFEENGTVLICKLNEDLDMASANLFKTKVEQYIASVSFEKMVFDLANIGFMDSTGVGALVQMIRLIQGRGARVRLTGYNEEIGDVLDLIGVLRIVGAE
ncbi:STAS domain-containing protein [Heliobacterium mobile]|nr:STAS domain-containing protein [Heliobacterium mobile]